MAAQAQKLLQSEPLTCIIYYRNGVREGSMSLSVRNRRFISNKNKHDFSGHRL
jgi:hypothetical protein